MSHSVISGFPGNNHSNIALLMQFMGMRPMSATFFCTVQSLYTVPAIQEFYDEMQADTLAKYQGKDLVLSGMLPVVKNNFFLIHKRYFILFVAQSSQ